jgi:hypothetical protein
VVRFDLYLVVRFELYGFGSICIGSVRFVLVRFDLIDSVRFVLIRFDLYWFGSICIGSVRYSVRFEVVRIDLYWFGSILGSI